MKKILILLLIAIFLLCGCSDTSKGDSCVFLTNANWEGNDGRCTNSITFGEDGYFSNSCACGSPVGDGDITEKFVYVSDEQKVLLYDCDDVLIEEGKILYCDDVYLIINVWGETYIYNNVDTFIPEVHSSVIGEIGLDEKTLPLLSTIELKDGQLSVSSFNYDGDAKDSFDVWTLDASENLKCKSISVKIVNDEATSEIVELSKDDLKHIGEYYTFGYLDFNEKGVVESIVFYGETIVWE